MACETASVTSLLEVPDLVMEAQIRLTPLTRCRFRTPAGLELASVKPHGQPLRALGRMFSDVPGWQAFDLEVIDVAGNRMLDIRKGRLGMLGGIRVNVALADGTQMGSVEGKVGIWGISGKSLWLRNGRGEAAAQLRAASIVRYDLLGPDGMIIGGISRRVLAAMPPGVLRVYDISFGPASGVAVRCLALTALVSADLRFS